MLRHMHEFLRAEKGATAIEYAMIAALMFLAIVGAVEGLGQKVIDVLYSKLIGAF